MMALLIVALSLAGQQHAVVTQADAPGGVLLSAQTDQYTVTLSKPSRETTSLKDFDLVVLNRADKSRKSIRLVGFVAEQATRVERIVIFQDRAMILGEFGGDAVIVADLRTGLVVDEFIGQRLVVSPTGQFAAFDEFRARVEADRGIVQRVYDVLAKPADRELPEPRRSGAMKDWPIQAGSRIFPPAPDHDRHGSTGLPIWLGPDRLAFADFNMQSGQPALVVTTVGPGGAPLQQRVVPLPVTPATVDETAVDDGRVIGNYFTIQDIRPLTPQGSRLRIRFEQNRVLRVRYLDVEVPQ
jgi:hypothetical protein